ncbi:MAG: hypothetical protein AAF270_13415 [Pseudomonadota bacterium]
MKNNSLLLILAMAGMLAMPGANATDLSYKFAELRFVDTEIDDFDGDGFRIGGSYPLDENWLIVGSFSTLDFDFGIDSSVLEIGAGYVHRYTDKIDLVGDARLVRSEVDSNFGDDTDTGFSVSGGIRGRINQDIEGRAALRHVNLDNSDTFIEVGGDFYFTPEFSAGLTLEFAGDADTLTIGARWFFD